MNKLISRYNVINYLFFFFFFFFLICVTPSTEGDGKKNFFLINI